MSEYKPIIDNSDSSEDEDFSSLKYGKCTKRKTLGAYFKQRIKKYYVDNQMKRIYEMNVTDTLTDHKAFALFKRFLNREGNDSEVISLIECISICKEIIGANKLDRLTRLIQICPKGRYEDQRVEIVEAYTHDVRNNNLTKMSCFRKLIETMYTVEMICFHTIEKNSVYINFKRELRYGSRKLRQHLGEMYEAQ